MAEAVTIGPCTLYHGDLLEVLPTLPPVECVITDPPYGIGESPTLARMRSCLIAACTFSVCHSFNKESRPIYA